MKQDEESACFISAGTLFVFVPIRALLFETRTDCQLIGHCVPLGFAFQYFDERQGKVDRNTRSSSGSYISIYDHFLICTECGSLQIFFEARETGCFTAFQNSQNTEYHR